ncbi:MAG TPA: phosphoribosyltransferase family protein [Candidatus Paceibacterota bacterium]|jgi:predicted phosphoribosyltransferase|nr:phosphoribosyltransferase family protein [Candidatus Paceibacterota bacterium]
MTYKDREEAGRALAAEIRVPKGGMAVFALPRGGVAVAYQVASALEVPLDTIPVRKLSAPANRELAFGAVAPEGIEIKDEEKMLDLGITAAEAEEMAARERVELDKEMAHYRSGRFAEDANFDTALIVDDGAATGMSAEAALKAARVLYASARLVFAVPVCSTEARERIEKVADEVICGMVPPYFLAVGEWYDKFAEFSDDEVLYLLHTLHDERVFQTRISEAGSAS